MNEQELDNCMMNRENVSKAYPFEPGVAVYSVGNEMFGIIHEGKVPHQISLRCDPLLSKILRDRYDEVMGGQHLNKKYWNTIVLTGQLGNDEIEDLIRLAYNLVANK